MGNDTPTALKGPRAQVPEVSVTGKPTLPASRITGRLGLPIGRKPASTP